MYMMGVMGDGVMGEEDEERRTRREEEKGKMRRRQRQFLEFDTIS